MPDELNAAAMLDLAMLDLKVSAENALAAWRVASIALCRVAGIANDLSLDDEAARERVCEFALREAQLSVDVLQGLAKAPPS